MGIFLRFTARPFACMFVGCFVFPYKLFVEKSKSPKSIYRTERTDKVGTTKTTETARTRKSESGGRGETTTRKRMGRRWKIGVDDAGDVEADEDVDGEGNADVARRGR